MMKLVRPKPLLGSPRVSVVIPCYNYGRYLADAVHSCIDEQPGVDVDVLIVDDASPDGSGDVARELAARDTRVRVLQHEKNTGHLQTYNDGLSAVTGEYVVLLSADDRLAPGSLGRAVALMQHEPSVGFVYGLTHKFHGQAKMRSERVRSWSVWNGRDWYEGRISTGRNPILSPEVVMRRELLADLGYYDLKLPHTADMYLWLRAAQVCDVGRVNGPYQAYYRMHDQQMHWVKIGFANDLRERLDCMTRAIDGDPRANGARKGQYARVRECLARESVSYASQAIDKGRLADFPIDELSEVAVELWPEITETVAWRMLEVRRRKSAKPVWAPAAITLRNGRKGVRWIRNRRYGV